MQGTTNLVHLTADQDTYWLLSCQLSSKGHLCGVVPWSEFIAGVSQAEALCNPSLHIRYSPNLSPSLQSQTGSTGCHTCNHEQLHTKREPSPQVTTNAMVEVFVISGLTGASLVCCLVCLLARASPDLSQNAPLIVSKLKQFELDLHVRVY